MTSTFTSKAIFSPEDRAIIHPFRAEYLKAKSAFDRRRIATSSILPAILGKWRQELGPGEQLDTTAASKVFKSFLLWRPV